MGLAGRLSTCFIAIVAVPRMADEAGPDDALAAKSVGFRAAYRPGPRKAEWQFGSTESGVL